MEVLVYSKPQNIALEPKRKYFQGRARKRKEKNRGKRTCTKKIKPKIRHQKKSRQDREPAQAKGTELRDRTQKRVSSIYPIE
jgi:hypothetical protein